MNAALLVVSGYSVRLPAGRDRQILQNRSRHDSPIVVVRRSTSRDSVAHT
jgi:hypothetical protein